MNTAFQPSGVWRSFGCNSMGMVVGEGRQVLLSGQVAWDEQRRVVGVGDMRAQVLKILENLEIPLNAGGAGRADAVRINVFAVDVDAYVADGALEVIAYFGDTKPASTTVQVARLVHPDWLVEIEATAIIDG